MLENKILQQTPGVNLDDRLRSVPGFSLFRRSSSLVSHPTTQGVSLRGIGASGTSRTLVLIDGVPANDPFGGWVYWTLFAPEEMERVEISRGASTSVFGDRAMGGAIALFTREPQRLRWNAGYLGGNQNTHDASAGISHVFSRFGVSGQWRGYTTEGYFITPEPRRGSVDRRSAVAFTTGEARADYLGTTNRFFLKASVLAEDRQNGTAVQTNSTGMGSISGHYSGQWNKDTVSVVAFHSREEFRSAFSAIAANRNTETLSFRQSVPSEAVGGAGLWRHGASQWNLLAGADAFRVEGTSIDSLAPTGKRIGGGTQFQHGVFAQGDATIGPAKFFAGLRHHFTGQDSTFLSPSAGVVLGRKRVRARGSVYRSFRAPTLNELFREFRQGNTSTQANPTLRPETLFGAEVGLDFIGESTRARFTFYRNSLTDLITNVTLSTTPALIVRRRDNAASALNRGAEFEATQQFGYFRGEIGYLFADSRFGTGERVPQIARHQGSALLVYDRNGTLVTAGVRSF
ncbi:MAG: TonB-dependent receptor, partial [Bryobacteraceae bacterium]